MNATTLLTRRALLTSATIVGTASSEAAQALFSASSEAAQALFSAAGVGSIDVTDGGLAGRYYSAGGLPPGPGIIMLNGSNGGYPAERDAADLAQAGFPTLALAYFQDRAGSPAILPSELVAIPIEYVFKAIDWMRAQPGVDPNRVVLMGESRGAELALLVASRRPDVAGVVGFVPSSHLWAGLPKVEIEDAPVPAWTSGGRSIPYQEPMHGSGLTLYQRFDLAKSVEAAAIPVEQIGGPILLFSSTSDGLWPSTRFAGEIIARLRDHKFRHFCRHIRFNDASHLMMGTGGAPTAIRGKTGEIVFSFGGSPESTLRARSAAWALTHRFMTGLVGRTFSFPPIK